MTVCPCFGRSVCGYGTVSASPLSFWIPGMSQNSHLLWCSWITLGWCILCKPKCKIVAFLFFYPSAYFTSLVIIFYFDTFCNIVKNRNLCRTFKLNLRRRCSIVILCKSECMRCKRWTHFLHYSICGVCLEYSIAWKTLEYGTEKKSPVRLTEWCGWHIICMGQVMVQSRSCNLLRPEHRLRLVLDTLPAAPLSSLSSILCPVDMPKKRE